MVFFVFYVLSWVVAVGFADIDRIVDYYWFNVLFIISRFLVQWGKSFSRTVYLTVAPEFTSVFSEVCGGQYSGFYVLSCGPMGNQHLFLLYLTLYIIYKIKVMFLQNWYLRETNVMFHVCPEMYPFCIPELQSWPEVKNTNMKFMKTQDKNTQISVYCIQHYCK